jgi:hypothetical protein
VSPDRRTKESIPFEEPSRVGKIISGGQTGVDRAALDVALELDIPCGGWCPKGRKSEAGPIDPRYPLQETGSTSYRVRTQRNVRESDGTLILTLGRVKGGTALTIKFAQEYGKPYLVIDLRKAGSPEMAREWRKDNRLKVLNVAGPRESESPGIHDQAVHFLRELFIKKE